MPAVDATKYSLSHFDNSDLWFNGNHDRNVKTGWLGRWIDRNGSDTNPLQAISIDTALSKSIRTREQAGVRDPVAAVRSASAWPGRSRRRRARRRRSTLNAQMRGARGRARGRREHVPRPLARDVRRRRRGVRHGQVDQRGDPGRRRLSGRQRDADHAASSSRRACSRRTSGREIITIHWGGFDTHSDQLASQDPQLTRALEARSPRSGATSSARGIEDQVCTLVFSEFGRRVADNGIAGTDHGAGGLMMAMGSGVRGGLASEWPGCETSEQTGGNIKVPTDFRSVYRSVIEEWLGDDPQAVLGGPAIPVLKRGDGLTGRTLFK